VLHGTSANLRGERKVDRAGDKARCDGKRIP